MDPASAIGVAAAAEQFAELTFKGVMLAVELGRRMNEQPKYVKDATDDLKLLRNIQQNIQASKRDETVLYACDLCNESIRELLDTLEKISRSPLDSKGRIVLKAIDSMRYEEEIKGQLQHLDSRKGSLMLALTSSHATKATTKNKFSDADGISESLNAAGSVVPSDQSGVDMFLRELRAESPQDARQRLIKEKGGRVDGTCSWVLAHNAYLSWISGKEQGLWIRGGPGRGKTMTSIFLTQELEKLAAELGGALLYFFCDSHAPKLSTQLGFLRSIVHQLCLARSSLALIGLAEYQRHGAIVANTVETLWRIARAMLQDFGDGPVFILIDGLDECDGKSISEICQEFAFLHALCPDGQRNVRPVIISRPLDVKCARHLASFRALQLDGGNENVSRDLSTFIRSKIATIAAENRYPDALHKKVLATVLQKSEGTFLWAGFVLSDLQQKSIVDVEDCLDSLPPQLDDIYGRILQNIPEDKTAVIENILKWVVLAVRPLTVSELAAAIGPESEKTPSTVELVTARIGICSHLLSISQGVVKLVHQSARDFLASDARPSTVPRRFFINVQQAHSEIAQLCISKMTDRLKTADFKDIFDRKTLPLPNGTSTVPSGLSLDDGPDKGLADDPLSATFAISPTLGPIVGYSVENWQHHARLSDGWDPSHDSFVSTFLKTESCRNWVHVSHQANRVPCPETVLLESETHLASFLGLKSIVRARISKKRHQLKQALLARSLRSSLVCASLLGGHTDIVRMLVEKEGTSAGKVPDGSSFFSSPIHIAAATNNVPALKLLLNKRTDIVNRVDENKWTPLHHAAFLDSVEACRFLISQGAHVDAPDFLHLTSLYYATIPARTTKRGMWYYLSVDDYRGFVRVFSKVLAATEHEDDRPEKASAVEVLLDGKARPNLAPGIEVRFTALHLAIIYRRTQEVKALVRAGADITARTAHGLPALYTSFANSWLEASRDEIASFLVDFGAQLDPDRETVYPLMDHAIVMQSPFLAALAIRLGTDLNHLNEYGHSFLHFAGSYNCKEVVDVLLDAGANINQGLSPLFAAASKGHWELFKYLLERGAQVKTDSGHIWVSVLIYLSSNYDPSIIKAMIGAGASPNELSKAGGSPMMIATMKGSHEVVEDLISEGADVNCSVGGISALTLALSGGHETIAKSLLAAGAKTADGTSPLAYVSSNGFDRMVGFLISAEGADPNEETSEGDTPVQVATRNGHEKVVAELIRAGADVNKTSPGRYTALSCAASCNHIGVARMLIEDAGANLNFDCLGQTALSLAVSAKHKGMVELLLQKGADKHFRCDGNAIADMETSGEIKELLR